MNTRRILSLENLNSAARMIVEDNRQVTKWKIGELQIFDELCLEMIPVVTLTGHDGKTGDEYFWICNEAMDGGLVVDRPDGLRYVDLHNHHLDVDTGEFYTPGER